MRKVAVFHKSSSVELSIAINNMLTVLDDNDGYVIKIHYSTAATQHYTYHSALIEYDHEDVQDEALTDTP